MVLRSIIAYTDKNSSVELKDIEIVYPIENESVAVGRIYVRSDTKEFFLDAINSILL